MAAETVIPNGLKNCPITPPIKPMGKKTATAVAVVAMTVKPISFVAEKAAWRGLSPSSMWRMMFSTSMIASSITLPITKAKASNVIVSRLKPKIAMTINVANKDVGIAKAEIRVARQFHKKGKITTIDNKTASSKASIVDLVAWRIYFA